MKPNITRPTSHGGKSDNYSEGASRSLIPTTPEVAFIHASPPAPPSPARLGSTSQRYLPYAAEWMMGNRVGVWGHYRDVEVEIGAPEASFVSHSRLPLTLKCAAHLTLSGETRVLFEAKAGWSMSRVGGGAPQCLLKTQHGRHLGSQM